MTLYRCPNWNRSLSESERRLISTWSSSASLLATAPMPGIMHRLNSTRSTKSQFTGSPRSPLPNYPKSTSKLTWDAMNSSAAIPSSASAKLIGRPRRRRAPSVVPRLHRCSALCRPAGAVGYQMGIHHTGTGDDRVRSFGQLRNSLGRREELARVQRSGILSKSPLSATQGKNQSLEPRVVSMGRKPDVSELWGWHLAVSQLE